MRVYHKIPPILAVVRRSTINNQLELSCSPVPIRCPFSRSVAVFESRVATPSGYLAPTLSCRVLEANVYLIYGRGTTRSARVCKTYWLASSPHPVPKFSVSQREPICRLVRWVVWVQRVVVPSPARAVPRGGRVV